MITPPRLEQVLAQFRDRRIGLLGDLFLDRYLEIDPELAELSIETGLDAYQVTRIRNSPGALGTIINNLVALGVGHLAPVTVLGDDGQAYDLRQALGALEQSSGTVIDLGAVVEDRSRLTPTYTKPLRRGADGSWTELNRLDLRNRAPLAAATEQAVIDRLNVVFDHTDGLIVLDQVNEEGWGVVTPTIREHLASLAAASPDKLVFVDSRAHIDRFRAGTLKPNLSECLRAVGRPASDDPIAGRDAAAELARRTGLRLFCTMGPQGILIVRPDAPPAEVPAYRVEGPIDIVGAGDSTTAGIVASLLSGASETEAAAVGNLVASITIQQLGTTGTATPKQVLARCGEQQ